MAYDFPASPSVGQVFNGWQWDGVKWVLRTDGGQLRRFAFIANASQTLFSGADLANNTLAYTIGSVEVVVNGIMRPQSDFTATNGSSITMGVALNAGDYVYIQSFDSLSLVDAVAMNAAQTTTDAQQKQARANIGMNALMRGYIDGCILSTAGASATFSVGAGVATDDTAVDIMLTAAISKTTSAWAVGSGNGAMDTGSVANSTWYHVWLIKRPDTGVVDVLFSLSATAPTMPANYTLKRRIGSMKTNGSAKWTKFVQRGDEFLWDVRTVDFGVANPGTSAVLRAVGVPTGIQVNALLNIEVVSTITGVAFYALFTSPDESDQTPSGNVFTFAMPGTVQEGGSGSINVRTNTSGQIRTRLDVSSANISYYCNTYGWIDPRGKNA